MEGSNTNAVIKGSNYISRISEIRKDVGADFARLMHKDSSKPYASFVSNLKETFESLKSKIQSLREDKEEKKKKKRGFMDDDDFDDLHEYVV